MTQELQIAITNLTDAITAVIDKKCEGPNGWGDLPDAADETEELRMSIVALIAVRDSEAKRNCSCGKS